MRIGWIIIGYGLRSDVIWTVVVTVVVVEAFLAALADSWQKLTAVSARTSMAAHGKSRLGLSVFSVTDCIDIG
jgi:hypothetical protein